MVYFERNTLSKYGLPMFIIGVNNGQNYVNFQNFRMSKIFISLRTLKFHCFLMKSLKFLYISKLMSDNRSFAFCVNKGPFVTWGTQKD